MNFLPFEGQIGTGDTSVQLNGEAMNVPVVQEAARGQLVFGVRPEHIAFNDSGAYRGRIMATEYLGTSQIVTLEAPNGEVKARIGSDQAAQVGEQVGLSFDARAITLFDEGTGRALRSDLNAEVLAHG